MAKFRKPIHERYRHWNTVSAELGVYVTQKKPRSLIQTNSAVISLKFDEVYEAQVVLDEAEIELLRTTLNRLHEATKEIT